MPFWQLSFCRESFILFIKCNISSQWAYIQIQPSSMLCWDQVEETHVPLLSKMFWAETGKVLPASAANLPDRLRSDPNTVTYNHLALRFLLYGVFTFLRCTRLILSSFEVLQWPSVVTRFAEMFCPHLLQLTSSCAPTESLKRRSFSVAKEWWLDITPTG